MEQVLEDGQDELVAGQTENKFANVSKLLADESNAVAAQAVGVAMQSLFQSRPETSSSSSMARAASVPGIKNSIVARSRKLLKRSSSAGSASSIEMDKHNFRTVVSHGFSLSLSCPLT